METRSPTIPYLILLIILTLLVTGCLTPCKQGSSCKSGCQLQANQKCCGDLVYNESSEICCYDMLFLKDEVNRSCCGDKVLHRDEICWKEEVISISTTPLNLNPYPEPTLFQFPRYPVTDIQIQTPIPTTEPITQSPSFLLSITQRPYDPYFR